MAPSRNSFPLVLLLALLWGASYPLVKVAIETIPPLTVVAFRSLLGGLFLLAALGPRARELGQFAAGLGWRELALQSAVNCFLPWLLVTWAVTQIDSGLATILNSLSPIFIFLLTAFVTRHEPVTRMKGIGVALGLSGVVTIVGLDALSGIGTRTVAELACVAGAFCYGIAAIRGVRFAKVNPLLPAAGTVLLSSAAIFPIALVVDQPWTVRPSMASVLCVIASGVFSTGLAFFVYFRLLATVGSITMSAQAYLRILIGVGLGVAFLDERPTMNTIAGLCLVIAGVVAMTRPEPRAP